MKKEQIQYIEKHRIVEYIESVYEVYGRWDDIFSSAVTKLFKSVLELGKFKLQDDAKLEEILKTFQLETIGDKI